MRNKKENFASNSIIKNCMAAIKKEFGFITDEGKTAIENSLVELYKYEKKRLEYLTSYLEKMNNDPEFKEKEIKKMIQEDRGEK